MGELSIQNKETNEWESNMASFKSKKGKEFFNSVDERNFKDKFSIVEIRKKEPIQRSIKLRRQTSNGLKTMPKIK